NSLAVGWIEREEFFGRHVRHGKGIMREVDSFLLLVPFVHGKIDDPAELETVLVDQPKLLGNSAARGAGEPGRRRRFVGSKKKAVAGSISRLGSDLALNVRRHELSDRTFAFVALPYDVSEPCCTHVGAGPLHQFVEP